LLVCIYYRVAVAGLATAIETIEQYQIGLRQQYPGLTAQLMRRHDSPPAGEVQDVTLMETYQGSVPELAAFLAAVDEQGQALTPWLAGQRHVEVFAPCASSRSRSI